MLRSLANTVRALGSMPSPISAGLAETIVSALRTRGGREAAPTFPLAARAGRAGRRWTPPDLISSRPQLRRTWLRVALPIGLLLGVVLSLVNQGGMLLAGQIDLRMCAICGLDFLLPLAALSVVLFAVTTRDGSRG
jgi:hypothetical protein